MTLLFLAAFAVYCRRDDFGNAAVRDGFGGAAVGFGTSSMTSSLISSFNLKASFCDSYHCRSVSCSSSESLSLSKASWKAARGSSGKSSGAAAMRAARGAHARLSQERLRFPIETQTQPQR